ncbi:MAG: acetate--CoA ligase family protein [Candidatus Nitrosocaldaceae archaeon]
MTSTFMNPKSIAVIGASEKSGSIGKAIITNIKNGYKGKIFPITPSSDTVFGIKAYKSVLDVDEKIDLAVIATPSKIVPMVLEECGKKGIKGAIIITAGFKEIGGEGEILQEQIKEIGKRYGIRIIGPNCLGVMNLSPDTMMNSTFLKVTPKSGNIALVSQSGAICAALVEDAIAQDIGFSAVVSIGNKVDFDECDILEMLMESKETKVIVMYLEEIMDGKRFVNVCKKITKELKIPVLVLKSGRTPEGAKAAMSHTGALMGSDEIYDAILRQAGAIRVDGMQELFDYATAFAKMPLPQDGVVIVTNAGGPGIIATDYLSLHSLKLADISDIRSKIEEVIPSYGSPRNPVDIVGDADYTRFKKVLSLVLNHKNVGSCIVMCTPSATLDYNGLANVITDMKSTNKTIVASLMGLAEGSENKKIMAEGGIPHYMYVELAIKALKRMYDYRRWLEEDDDIINPKNVSKEAVKSIIDGAKREGRANLLEEEGYEILKAYGLPIPSRRVVNNEEDAVIAAKDIGYPLVLKIVSPDIIHKSDAGAVKVNLRDEREVREAYNTIISNVKRYNPNARITGILVEEMVKNGKEVIIGAKKDPKFGPIVMFGLGGIYVEVLKDVTFRLAPIGNKEARRMINEIKMSKLLDGVRGEKPSDKIKLAECIERLSQLVNDFPEISEIDMNPVMVLEEGKGCKVVDVRIGLNL